MKKIHIFVALLSLYGVFHKRKELRVQQYHPTVLYIIIGSLLYFVLTYGYFLWTFVPDVPSSVVFTELLYTFVVFPCTVILFLHHFPGARSEKLKRYGKWIAIYALVELSYCYTNRITYDHGWNWAWSVGFDAMMFTMLRLHSVKPVAAYLLSVVIIAALVLWFKVPLKDALVPRPHTC